MNRENLVPLKVNVIWPVIILTKEGTIKTKSRAITDQGLFVHFDKKLPQNETCKIVIRPSPSLFVVLRCKLAFSNLSPMYYGSPTSNRGLSFAKISNEDRHILNDLMSLMMGRGMERITKVRMELHLETDRRTVTKDFDNLNDLRLFMHNFFSLPEVFDRRAEMPLPRYTGPERRMQT